MTDATRYWAVVPAAGTGQRMNLATPKQYLPLAGRTVIEHVLSVLTTHPLIKQVVVCTSEHDKHWVQSEFYDHASIRQAWGGETRADSVLSGLRNLSAVAHDHDWVFVHDAARPCLTNGEIDALIDALQNKVDGAVLAVPISDTVKQATVDGCVATTLDRRYLWRAATPQVFRLGALRTALTDALAADDAITDESSAMERAGYTPVLVEGQASNLKITHADDLELAEYYLQRRGKP